MNKKLGFFSVVIFSSLLSSCAGASVSVEVETTKNADGSSSMSGKLEATLGGGGTTSTPPLPPSSDKCFEIQFFDSSNAPIGMPIQVPVGQTGATLVPPNAAGQTTKLVDCDGEELTSGPAGGGGLGGGNRARFYTTFYRGLAITDTGINPMYIVRVKAGSQSEADQLTNQYIAGNYSFGDSLPNFVTAVSLTTYQLLPSGNIEIKTGVMKSLGLAGGEQVASFTANWNGTPGYVNLSSLANPPVYSGDWSYVGFEIQAQDVSQGTDPGVLYQNYISWSMKTIESTTHDTGSINFDLVYN